LYRVALVKRNWTLVQLRAGGHAMSVQRGIDRGGRGVMIVPGVAIADDVARGRPGVAPLSDAILPRKIVLALPNTRRAVQRRGPAWKANATDIGSPDVPHMKLVFPSSGAFK